MPYIIVGIVAHFELLALVGDKLAGVTIVVANELIIIIDEERINAVPSSAGGNIENITVIIIVTMNIAIEYEIF